MKSKLPTILSSFLGPKTWNIVPTRAKEVRNLSAFKSGFNKRGQHRLCKRKLPNICFI